MDIFAGSNTTGAVSEIERRRWMAFDVSLEYLAASSFRFIDSDTTETTMRDVYARLLRNESIDTSQFVRQGVLLEAPLVPRGRRREVGGSGVKSQPSINRVAGKGKIVEG